MYAERKGVQLNFAGSSEAQAYALLMIVRERKRQDVLKAEGRFKMTLADDMPEPEKLGKLVEELGEIARKVSARSGFTTDGDCSDESLLTEVIQVGALAFAWAESMT